VGIGTGYGLGGRGPGNGGGGARFFAPVRTDRGAHPASYTIGNGSFTRVDGLGRSVDHPSLSSAEVKEKVELYHYSPLSEWHLP